MEAAAWHQLGVVFHEQQQWQEAERHYLEAARIREQHGDLIAAQQSWDQLALLNQSANPVGPLSALGIEAGDSADLPFQLTLYEEWTTDYGLVGDLLVDGPRATAQERAEPASR